MRKYVMKKVTAVSLAVTLAAGAGIPVRGSQEESLPRQVLGNAGEAVLPSPVLVTELIPNTDNISGSDAYEYYELTNVSDRDVDLSNYNVLYINGDVISNWNPDIKVLKAGTSMLVWIKNDANKETDKSAFLDYYGLPQDIPVAEVTCGGLHNSGPRTMAIATRTGKVLTRFSYQKSGSSDGTIGVDEAIDISYDGEVPVVSYDHTPSPLTVTVEDTNLDIESIVAGTVLVNGEEKAELVYAEDGKLSGTVAASELRDLTGFHYAVSITDGVNTATSAAVEVKVIPSAEEVDTGLAPALTITEILPDSSNLNGSDAYEFIEIYNNSNQTINLKDYKLYYNYPDTGADNVWWETSEDKFLASGETIVFWIKNAGNQELDTQDFNAKFGVSLNEDNLIQIQSGGMANGSRRGIRIASNVKDTVDYVMYNDGVDDTTPDYSITYQNQYQDKVFQTVMTDNHAVPTPGEVTGHEKPDYQAVLAVPDHLPALDDLTLGSFGNASDSLEFAVAASSDAATIKTVTLHVKYNDKESFESYQLTRTQGDIFSRQFLNVDLLNKKSFTYYFEVSDGFGTAKTPEKTIYNTDTEAQSSELNVKEQETVAGKKQLIAHGQQLLIDGQDVSAQAETSINGAAKFAFEASDTDVFFKNAVAVSGQTVGIFNEGTYSEKRTYVYDIDASLIDAEHKTVTVEIHAGNKANALEHNIENNDDFVIRNIRLVLPDGDTVYPSFYEAKLGLGAVEHDNLDQVAKTPYAVESQETEIKMGDTAGKPEILYAVFELDDSAFNAVRYLWDTSAAADGSHVISNGAKEVNVIVDNTAPEITTGMEENKEYHNAVITAEAIDAVSGTVPVTAYLDGTKIALPYEFRAAEMKSGTHVLSIMAEDEVGNQATKEVTFTTPEENASITNISSPSDYAVVTGSPVFEVEVEDASQDEMTVSFKKGERYSLSDSNITRMHGVSNVSGDAERMFDNEGVNGFPYECFDIEVSEEVSKDAVVDVTWTGTSSSKKTFMYVYNTSQKLWEQMKTDSETEDGQTMLRGSVSLENHLSGRRIQVMVQNGEGYTPKQYAPVTGDAVSESAVVETSLGSVTVGNVDDTARSNYDFTFAVESDTQYYNEDYEGNPDQDVDGVYQYQLDIHNWLLQNRRRMNIQYLFHDGDIIDDEPNTMEWEQADAAYRLLDDAGLPYGVLAGNHDVGHLSGDYTNYGKYFGEDRYAANPWYGGSYKNNRGHYDLISVGGIDFIMVYMGWGIGDEEIEWLNGVLAQYPERRAILNFHEYLLASGGLGEEPQRVYDEVISKNENVCMVFSGHYHNAKTRIDTFTNADGTERKVYNMLFDYQGLPEGGLGYMRLLHFDLEGKQLIVRTYSPSIDDYDAKTSLNANAGNAYVVPGADDGINDEESFVIPFEELGIVPQAKTIETTGLEVNVYGTEVIGTVEHVSNGKVSYEWKDAPAGIYGWYAQVTDAYDGLTRTNVRYVQVSDQKETEEPEESERPVQSKEPEASKIPVQSEEPVTSKLPMQSEEPVTSEPPVQSEQPVESENPVSSKEPDSQTGMPGDVNGDSKVDLKDAQAALRMALKIEVTQAQSLAYKNADVNGDGVVDLTDAQSILKYALKINDQFK